MNNYSSLNLVTLTPPRASLWAPEPYVGDHSNKNPLAASREAYLGTRWFAFLLDLRKREEFPDKELFTRRWALTAGRTLGFHLLDLHKTYI